MIIIKFNKLKIYKAIKKCRCSKYLDPKFSNMNKLMRNNRNVFRGIPIIPWNGFTLSCVMSYLRYLCLIVYRGVQHILYCVFVLLSSSWESNISSSVSSNVYVIDCVNDADVRQTFYVNNLYDLFTNVAGDTILNFLKEILIYILKYN